MAMRIPLIISAVIFYYFLAIFMSPANGCEVLARIKSSTKKPVKFEISMPDVFKEQVELNEPGEKDILVK